MENKTKNNNNLKIQDIIDVAYEAVIQCYGVVGVCQKGATKLVALDKATAKKGILVRKIGEYFSVEISLILALDVKISEAIRETQKTVRYMLNKKTGNKCKNVDVFALTLN